MVKRRGRVHVGSRERIPSDFYDFGIVGAGIYGLPLAYFLARGFPDARVLLLEDNGVPGQCITVNTGGVIRACYANPDVMAVSAFARKYYAQPTEMMELEHSVHTGFFRTGWGRFVNEEKTPGILRGIEGIAANARARGIPHVFVCTMDEYLRDLTPARRANLAKVFHPKDVTHVLVDENGGYADGGTALLAFLKAALEYGADVSTYASVQGFLRKGLRVEGVQVLRWRPVGLDREPVGTQEVRLGNTIIAAGLGARRLVERGLGWKMPTFPSYHQTPIVESTPDFPIALERHPRTEAAFDAVAAGAGRAAPVTREVEIAALPTVSHWRDFYFRPEGRGILVGAHHQELQDEDYVPEGGKLPMGDTALPVGLIQPLLDALLANLDHFPLLNASGLRLGRKAADLNGGFYVMNPEELPFEGPIPGTENTAYYIGSGGGTGFKLGPGVAYLLYQRLAGVPLTGRIIQSDALSVERAEYFYPRDTPDPVLRDLFRPVEAGGRFHHIGAAGISPTAKPSA